MASQVNRAPARQSTRPPLSERLNLAYFTKLQGILRIVQVVLSCCTFISASVGLAGAWIQFFSMATFIMTMILMLLYLFYVVNNLPKSRNIAEMIYYIPVTLCYFVSAFVTAAKGARHSSIAATAFFCFACVIAYGLDMGLQFYAYLHGRRIDGYVPRPGDEAGGGGGVGGGGVGGVGGPDAPPRYPDDPLYENAEMTAGPPRAYTTRDYQHDEEGDAFVDPPPAYQQARIYNPRY